MGATDTGFLEGIAVNDPDRGFGVWGKSRQSSVDNLFFKYRQLTRRAWFSSKKKKTLAGPI